MILSFDSYWGLLECWRKYSLWGLFRQNHDKTNSILWSYKISFSSLWKFSKYSDMAILIVCGSILDIVLYLLLILFLNFNMHICCPRGLGYNEDYWSLPSHVTHLWTYIPKQQLLRCLIYAGVLAYILQTGLEKSSHTKSYLVIWCHIRSYKVLQSHAKSYEAIWSPTKSYGAIPSHT